MIKSLKVILLIVAVGIGVLRLATMVKRQSNYQTAIDLPDKSLASDTLRFNSHQSTYTCENTTCQAMLTVSPPRLSIQRLNNSLVNNVTTLPLSIDTTRFPFTHVFYAPPHPPIDCDCVFQTLNPKPALVLPLVVEYIQETNKAIQYYHKFTPVDE